jgi:hypothetical protein
MTGEGFISLGYNASSNQESIHQALIEWFFDKILCDKNSHLI